MAGEVEAAEGAGVEAVLEGVGVTGSGAGHPPGRGGFGFGGFVQKRMTFREDKIVGDKQVPWYIYSTNVLWIQERGGLNFGEFFDTPPNQPHPSPIPKGDREPALEKAACNGVGLGILFQ
jgi:hypothetical protein